jgi:hypothetical protein
MFKKLVAIGGCLKNKNSLWVLSYTFGGATDPDR